MTPKCPALQKSNSSCSNRLDLSDVTKKASFFCPNLFLATTFQFHLS